MVKVGEAIQENRIVYIFLFDFNSLIQFINKVMNDVFGIQVRSGCSCTGPFGIKLLKLNEKQIDYISKDILKGHEETKPGWVRLDTYFLFKQYELDYIIESLYLIAKYGERIRKYYHQNQHNGQFQIPGYKPVPKNWSLAHAKNTPKIYEYPIEMRRELLTN